jgi:hypothetical protein
VCARCRSRAAAPTVVSMTNTHESDVIETVERKQLLDEIQRYLAAVDEFRREGCSVPWCSEEVERWNVTCPLS